MQLFDFDHLNQSTKVSGKEYKNFIHKYLWHWGFAMKEAVMLFWVAFLSVLHAFFPFLFGWWLLEKHVSMLKYTKSKVPNNKTMKKVIFKE